MCCNVTSLGPCQTREAAESAPDLEASGWHYVVVDTKFTTLRLNAKGTELSNDGNLKAYKAQLFIYNRMLGRLQGFEPPSSYLLGRGWEQTSKGVTSRCADALDRLGPVPQNGTFANKLPIADAVEEALQWVRRVRTEGKEWQLIPKPSVPELYPNMTNIDDGDMMLQIRPAEREPGFGQEEPVGQWTAVKKWLAGELKELTQLWQVGVTKRRQAHQDGIYRWEQPTDYSHECGGHGQGRTNLFLEQSYRSTPARVPRFSPCELRRLEMNGTLCLA